MDEEEATKINYSVCGCEKYVKLNLFFALPFGHVHHQKLARMMGMTNRNKCLRAEIGTFWSDK
jgi:hypothetical protein